MTHSRLLIALLAGFACGCAYIPKEHFGPLYSAEGVFLNDDRAILLLAETRYQAVQMLIPAPMPALLDRSNMYAAAVPLSGGGGPFQFIQYVNQIDWPKESWTIWNASENYCPSQTPSILLAPAKQFTSPEIDHVSAMTLDHSHALVVTKTSAILFDTRDGTTVDDPAVRPLVDLFVVINQKLGRPGDWSLSDDLRYVLIDPPTEHEEKYGPVSIDAPIPVLVDGVSLDLWRDAVVYDRAEKQIIRIDSGDRFTRPCMIAVDQGAPVILYGQPLGGMEIINPRSVKSLSGSKQWPLHFDRSPLEGGQIKEPICAWDPSHHRVALMHGNDPYPGNQASERTPEKLNGHYLVEVYDYVSQMTILHREFDSNTIRDVIASLSVQPVHP